MENWQMNVLAYGFAIVAVVAVILGVYWLIWLVWCAVLPQLWPGGPEVFISPGYWLFVGTAFLLSFVGRTLFGQSKSSRGD